MDLTTEYLGLSLENPIVPSSSPLSHNVDDIRRLEDAGAPAVVMYSLFESSIKQMIGSMSQVHVAEPSAFERANYMKTLASFRPQARPL